MSGVSITSRWRPVSRREFVRATRPHAVYAGTVRVSVRGGLDGAPSYFAFAAVGVSLSVVLRAAITGVSRRLREEQLTGTLEALYAQPISATELALSSTLVLVGVAAGLGAASLVLFSLAVRHSVRRGTLNQY